MTNDARRLADFAPCRRCLAPEATPRGLTYDDTLLPLLDGVRISSSLAAAARALVMSYLHAWGMMRAKVAQLVAELIGKQPGRDATVTAFGKRLLWTHSALPHALPRWASCSCSAAALEAPRFTALIELLQGARFRRDTARLTGYDVQVAGMIERLDEALPWDPRRIAPKPR
jgi:molybdate transport repressor ModE-like protein